MRPLTIWYILQLSLSIDGFCQVIVDPCFVSIPDPGKFAMSEDIINMSYDSDIYEASDLLEWRNGEWTGAHEGSNVKIPPPAGCSTRAIWIGYESWTYGGEAFGLRLDKPLTAGKTYRYTFTYAGDGKGNNQKFAPTVYTNGDREPKLVTSFKVGKLPVTSDWRTSIFEFTAQSKQEGHTWIVIYSHDCSGIFLSNCIIENPIINDFPNQDTTICLGSTVKIKAPDKHNYQYTWNNGDTTSSIVVNSQGQYDVHISYGSCVGNESVYVNVTECISNLIMPNVFSPNGDSSNPFFIPKSYDFIKSGTMNIYNRWGDLITTLRLLEGWDGNAKGSECSTGIYFYTISYEDDFGKSHVKKGMVTLVR
jgi:gliding motility-associated-like protein